MDTLTEFFGTKLIQAAPEDRDGRPGYAVIYKDGYRSWSPKEAFEDAYQPLHRLSFGHAILAMKMGKRLSRAGWNGKGQSIAIQIPDANSANTLPYIYIVTVSGDRVPWLASQTDMLAEDWFVVGQN